MSTVAATMPAKMYPSSPHSIEEPTPTSGLMTASATADRMTPTGIATVTLIAAGQILSPLNVVMPEGPSRLSAASTMTRPGRPSRNMPTARSTAAATKPPIILPLVDMAVSSGHRLSRVSLDHLVGAREQRRWHVDAEDLSSRQIDDEIELGRLLDRDVGRLRTPQNPVDVVCGSPKQVGQVWSIGHQTSHFDILARAVHRRQPRAQRQDADANPVGNRQQVECDIKCVGTVFKALEHR